MKERNTDCKYSLFCSLMLIQDCRLYCKKLCFVLLKMMHTIHIAHKQHVEIVLCSSKPFSRMPAYSFLSRIATNEIRMNNVWFTNALRISRMNRVSQRMPQSSSAVHAQFMRKCCLIGHVGLRITSSVAHSEE